MTRDEAARALAEKMGWVLQREDFAVEWGGAVTLEFCIGPIVPVRPEEPNGVKRWSGGVINLPAPDAPLPEKLAFVGHVAVAVSKHGAEPYRLNIATEGGLGAVVWINDHRGDAPDLCWAALLSGLAVLEAR